jgi:hypothetical protein
VPWQAGAGRHVPRKRPASLAFRACRRVPLARRGYTDDESLDKLRAAY